MLLTGTSSNSSSCKAELENGSGKIILNTGPIIMGDKGTTIRILISSVFDNPNRITYSNASI